MVKNHLHSIVSYRHLILLQLLALMSILQILGICNLVVEGAPPFFNVTDFGAIGDGKTDDSKAFIEAWKALCGASMAEGAPTLTIPAGKTFLLQPVTFLGPCASGSVYIRVSGNIVAPTRTSGGQNWSSGKWLSFSYIRNLSISGPGQFDGQGSSWWTSRQQFNNRPTALHFNQCDNLTLRGLTHINSPRNHISINGCTGAIISHLNIIAPKDSPNTDGIDISRSRFIKIRDSTIATGDDCVAINGNSSNIRIIKVFCGPGHGISVGSLGPDGATDYVEEVHVGNCTFNGTQNAARIKTWQGGQGFARRISFWKITLIASENPIIIDQHYCNGAKNCKNGSTAVAVSDVTYSDFTGTSAEQEAIRLDCNEILGCTNIVMNRINLTTSPPLVGQTVAYCKNVNGNANNVIPRVNCLSGA